MKPPPPDYEERLASQENYYATKAESYDAACFGNRDNRSHAAKLHRIHSYLHLQPGARVLEIGAGTGIHGAQLLKWNPQVHYTGVDLSQDMLDQAQARLGDQATLHCGPAERLPFEDASFDGVFCCATIHHLADKEAGIAEMIRVLRPNHPIVLCEPNLLNPLNIRQWMFIPEEKGQLEIRPRKIASWFQRHDASLEQIDFLNFTPPGPPQMETFLNRVDRCCSQLPLLRRISSVVLFSGRRLPDETTHP